MNLGRHTRAIRAITTLFACAGLVVAPAAADAAAKSKKPLREAKSAKPAKKVVVKKPAASNSGLGSTLALSATTQLAAMNTALRAAPEYFAGRNTGCSMITAMLASQPGTIMAGNFRDSGGNCYVWLNLQQSSMLTGSEICKTTLHEFGHLAGLQHTSDSTDVMYSPFVTDPIPAPCRAQAGAVSAKASAAVCPPGAANADYCQAVKPKKKAKRARRR